MKAILFVIVVVLSLSQPCLAETKINSHGLQKAALEVIGNASTNPRSCGNPQKAEIYRNTDLLADFWIVGGGRIIVRAKASGNGNTIGGKNAYEWAENIASFVRTRLAIEGPKRNLDPISTTCQIKGDRVLTLDVHAISGNDVSESFSRHSDSYSYRRSGGSSSSHDRDSSEKLGVSLYVGLSLEQYQGGTSYRTLPLLESSVVLEESQLVGMSEESGGSRKYSYTTRRGSSSSSSSNQEGYRWQRDQKRAEAQILNPQAMKVSGLVVGPIFDGIATDIQNHKYRSNRDREERSK
ncbi:MAG: hypothetical protein M1324_02680 [Patescibacteria group bacterium]|nr:hypothetical protein [Patescibacteria group bacterium]